MACSGTLHEKLNAFSREFVPSISFQMIRGRFQCLQAITSRNELARKPILVRPDGVILVQGITALARTKTPALTLKARQRSFLNAPPDLSRAVQPGCRLHGFAGLRIYDFAPAPPRRGRKSARSPGYARLANRASSIQPGISARLISRR
jgi:hypothetical protein